MMKEFSSNKLSVRASPQWQPVALAALVHGLLLAFLWVGVQWQSKETTAVEAEVWDMTTREAAPKALPPPEAAAEIEKIAPPVPAKDLMPEKEVVKDLIDPEIALAQEKKRKRLEKQQQEQLQEQLKEKQQEKQAELKRELKLEREEALKKEKLAEQKKKAEKLAADDAEKKKQLDLAKQLDLSKQKNKEQQAKEQAARDKTFSDNMRRLAAQAGTQTGAQANVGSGGTGEAAKSMGNNRGDPSYAARIAAKVRSNTVYNTSDNVSGNPTVEYRIDLLPDGSLRGAIRKLKSSGVAAFDDAVEKAIEKSLPFPRDKSGEVPASIVYVHRMKE
ncbi:hypothetical protein BH11PSE12_BH11PSE12_03450 [soil metagenome]